MDPQTESHVKEWLRLLAEVFTVIGGVTVVIPQVAQTVVWLASWLR